MTFPKWKTYAQSFVCLRKRFHLVPSNLLITTAENDCRFTPLTIRKLNKCSESENLKLNSTGAWRILQISSNVLET